MAKGRKQHQAYLEALSLLGKDLARRAGSKCELTQMPGSLKPYDLEGSDTEPALSHVVLVSEAVHDYLEGRGLQDAQLHFLETAVWSTEPAIRRAAVQILEYIDETWAHAAIDNARSMD